MTDTQTNGPLSDTPPIHNWIEKRKAIRQSAIERCAQVAEQIRDCDYQSMLKIAAAIRKLKDET